MPHILLPEDFLPEMSYTLSWTEEGEKRVSRRKKEQKRKSKTDEDNEKEKRRNKNSEILSLEKSLKK